MRSRLSAAYRAWQVYRSCTQHEREHPDLYRGPIRPWRARLKISFRILCIVLHGKQAT